MSMIWADGFEHWGSLASFVSGGYLITNTNQTTLIVNAAIARTGTTYLHTRSTTTNWTRNFVPMNFCTMGVAYRCTDFNNNTACVPGYQMSGAGGNGLAFKLMNDGSVAIIKAQDYNVIIFATAPNLYKTGTWNYFEFQCDVAGGKYTLRLNNVVIAQGNYDFGGTQITNVGFVSNYGQSYFESRESDHADFYVTTSDIAGPNPGFLGDIRCRTVYPTANGPDQSWTVTGAANAVAAINQIPFDPGRYISGANVGDVSNFEVGDIPANTSYVAGLHVFMAAGKSDAGTCEITPEISSGGVTADLPAIAPGVAPAYYSRIIESDPATGLYWSKAAVNAVRVGMKRTA